MNIKQHLSHSKALKYNQFSVLKMPTFWHQNEILKIYDFLFRGKLINYNF